MLAESDAQVPLDDLERALGRGEERADPAEAEPERPVSAAREVEHVRSPLVEPGRRHRAAQILERAGVRAGVGRQREDRLRVDGHPRLRAGAVELAEDLVVVDDDPVVDPDDRPVADGMVVGRDRRVPFRVVTHVDERVGGCLGNVDPLEQARWPGVRCFTTVEKPWPADRYAYPTASAPRSAIPASRA